MGLKLHDYQRLAVDFLHHQPRAGLFFDPGLGKTAIALSALTPDHLPALVCAPKRVAEHVWPVEAKLWRPDLSVALAGGPATRRLALAQEADVTVIGRDNLTEAEGGRYRTLILDELSGFKDYTTNRWKAARRIVNTTPHMWGLTGTPSPNGLIDLWAQIYLMDAGARLGKNITTYRSRYFRPGLKLNTGVIVSWDIREEATDNIHALVDDICLSMDEIEGMVPPVTYNTVTVPLSPAVRKLYRKFKRELVVDLDVLGGEVHSAGNAAVLTGRLSQMSAGFLYSDEANGVYDVLHREKIAALVDLVAESGSPVLVFYAYQAELKQILEALPQARQIDDPGAIEDWNRGAVPVLLAHPASAGHGLNLQHGGHTVVWTTLTWSLELWKQANARVARQGQRHPVVVHTLQTEDTIDTVIRQALDDKDFAQTALLDHLRSPL